VINRIAAFRRGAHFAPIKIVVDSNTVNCQSDRMTRSSTYDNLQKLAQAVNDWCAERGFVPASGQAAENLSERSLRYYRSLGLLDGPKTGEGSYVERHFLQLAAIRVLQSRGMPLRRIQELLYGRTDANLRELLTRARQEHRQVATMPPFASESWNVIPLEGSFALIGRDGARPTAAQVAAINRILQKKTPVTK
jgi:hypothetical protein